MKPERVIRIGAVSASVFLNEIGEGEARRTVRNANVQRNYRAEDGNWKSTNSFSLAELAQLRVVVDQAIEYVAAEEADVTPVQ